MIKIANEVDCSKCIHFEIEGIEGVCNYFHCVIEDCEPLCTAYWCKDEGDINVGTI